MIATLVLAGTLAALPKGEWVDIFPESEHVEAVVTDAQGTLYLLSTGKLRYADGRWDSIPSLRAWSRDVMIINSRDYWVAGRVFDPLESAPLSAKGSLTHFRDGKAAVYDTSNSCLDGNMFRPLGIDGSGRLIVDQRYFFGLGGPSKGVIRFDGKDCEAIPLELQMEAGAKAYARDSAGREFFSIGDVSDVPVCRGFLRLDAGRLDTLASQGCGEKLVVRGTDVYAATGGGLWIFSGDTIRKIPEIRGRAIPNIYGILFDSRGVLWIATEGYDFFPENIGLVAISGKDTAIYNQDNSRFRGYFARSLSEDPQGNIWVVTWDQGVIAFARDKSALALGHSAAAGRYRIFPAGVPGYDLLGRRVGSGSVLLRGPWNSPGRSR
jgi:hypothetical protein